jgi:hypothetical protein
MTAPTFPLAMPVRLAVLHSIAEALRSMGPQTGCYFQVTREEDVTLDSRVLADAKSLPAFVVQPAPGGTREFQPANRMKETFPVLISGRVDATGISDMARRITAFELLVADLERVLTIDITRGGIAVDTRAQSPREPYVDPDPVNTVYIEQPVDVILRRIYGTPEGS